MGDQASRVIDHRDHRFTGCSSQRGVPTCEMHHLACLNFMQSMVACSATSTELRSCMRCAWLSQSISFCPRVYDCLVTFRVNYAARFKDTAAAEQRTTHNAAAVSKSMYAPNAVVRELVPLPSTAATRSAPICRSVELR